MTPAEKDRTNRAGRFLGVGRGFGQAGHHGTTTNKTYFTSTYTIFVEYAKKEERVDSISDIQVQHIKHETCFLKQCFGVVTESFFCREFRDLPAGHCGPHVLGVLLFWQRTSFA